MNSTCCKEVLLLTTFTILFDVGWMTSWRMTKSALREISQTHDVEHHVIFTKWSEGVRGQGVFSTPFRPFAMCNKTLKPNSRISIGWRFVGKGF